MPSDPRTQEALAAMAPGIAAFRTTLTAGITEVGHYLGTARSSAEDRLARVAVELGPFGARHVDARRLEPLLRQPETADPTAVETVEQALATLRDLVAASDDLHVVVLPTGWSLHDAVDEALARIGRAFGAARVVAAIRAGSYRLNDHARSLGSYPFTRWTRAERLLAPPLVVEVAGADLGAAALADFLDGSVKIVLVVTGTCSPAPLVRLITPGVFALQAPDAAGLQRFAAWDGPGIAALVPEDAARFVHDPATAPAAVSRLTVSHVPDGRRRPVGGLSIAQQAEELRLLAALSAPAASAVSAAAAISAPATNGAPPDPAGKLAAWLLSQADLTDLG